MPFRPRTSRRGAHLLAWESLATLTRPCSAPSPAGPPLNTPPWQFAPHAAKALSPWPCAGSLSAAQRSIRELLPPFPDSFWPAAPVGCLTALTAAAQHKLVLFRTQPAKARKLQPNNLNDNET